MWSLDVRALLAMLVVVLACWAMTDCGSQHICRLRGGMVAHEPGNADNWRCLP